MKDWLKFVSSLTPCSGCGVVAGECLCGTNYIERDMSDEELQTHVPIYYALNLGKICRREVVEWIKYQELTGTFPAFDLVLKIRGSVHQQQAYYTAQDMIEQCSGKERI